ncbi:MAG: hemerythrin domain-containing protein [Bdellovibrionaceae bacterium]|nr:hemerythrin domain-containing protein [Pseudobdellovibrionaceae bacterium]
MSKTEHFRADHKDMVGIVGEISKLLNEAGLGANPAPVTGLLGKLVGKLKIHLVTEDRSLYPQLLKSSDPKVKATAEKFQAEMGGIKTVVEAFATKWMDPREIKAHPAAFIKETKGLFDALAKRIEKEDNELYALADKAA